MGLTTVLRGFKIPVAILDRFLEANRVEPTGGYPPYYNRSELDAGSIFLRAKVDATAGHTRTRIFMPQREGQSHATYAYVAYAWVMVDAQYKLDLLEDLPDRAPPGFAELRNELLGYADGGEEETFQVKRLDEGPGDPTAALFVVVNDERYYSLGLFPRKVSANFFLGRLPAGHLDCQLTV
jgi:hypothetical protein